MLVTEMVKRRKNVSNRRINRQMRAYAGASYDASDRAAVSARFHIAPAERASAIGIGVPRAEGSFKSGADLSQLAIPSRRQSALERKMQGGRYRRLEGSATIETQKLP